jgi:hypothetical protein
MARREQELAQLHLYAVADPQGPVFGHLPGDRGGVIEIGLPRVADGSVGRDKSHSGVEIVGLVVVVAGERRTDVEKRAELRGIQLGLGGDVENNFVAAFGHLVDDLDLGNPLLPVKGQIVVVFVCRGKLGSMG